ncbi:MAG: hypothetical protein ABI322_07570 [Gemmatimonadaceae bacterium]
MILAIGCGDSATGTRTPTVSGQDALASLQSSLPRAGAALGASTLTTASIGAITASDVGQATVTIDGVSAQAFAFALQTTFPAGTCLEQLVTIIPTSTTFGALAPKSICTPPPSGVAFIIWQTSSASAPPDRIVIVYANLGTVTFADFGAFSSDTSSAFPAFAIYMERSGAISFSSAGTFTSSVGSVGQVCSPPLPSFATSATCARATFGAAGHVSFVAESALGSGVSNHSLDIPAIDVPGIIENFTGLIKR